MDWLRLLLIGIGGFAGSILRYVISGAFQKSAAFPFGTMAVNLIGCLCIGFLSHLAETRGLFTTETRLFLFVGILGGFTTFSAFGNETMNLFRDGQAALASANVAANVVLGLGCVWIGRSAAFLIWR